MHLAGELNVGQLARERFGSDAFLVGFTTHTGTVTAARNWDDPAERRNVRPSVPGSYEHLFHESGIERFLLPLRQPARPEVREELETPRLERAIGVIYRPDTELASHYFQAMLPRQFDEYVWFDRTQAVAALPAATRATVPETYPFGV